MWAIWLNTTLGARRGPGPANWHDRGRPRCTSAGPSKAGRGAARRGGDRGERPRPAVGGRVRPRPRTCSRHLDGLSARPVASVSRRSPRSRAHRGHRAGFVEVGSGGDQGQHIEVSAGHAHQLQGLGLGRTLQKIVGGIVGAASRTGREHLQGSSPPESTESRIRGDLDVRVPRRSARARASVRRWPWSSRRGRQRGKGVGACHLVSQRRCKVQCRATGRPMNGSPTIGERR